MITAFGFATAAAVGALARAAAGQRLNRPDGFPVGTLVVNVTGSFLLGLLSTTTPPLFTVLGVGGLGAFTTFSSFARDTVALAELNSIKLAILYVALSCSSILAAAIGVAIA